MPVGSQRFESRQSMKNKQFEVFHYRDKKMDGVGIHHHDFFAVYFFLSGRVSFKVEGRSYHLEPGDLLLQVDNTRILSMDDLNSVLYRHQVGDTVKAVIFRGGQQAAVDLVLTEDKG